MPDHFWYETGMHSAMIKILKAPKCAWCWVRSSSLNVKEQIPLTSARIKPSSPSDLKKQIGWVTQAESSRWTENRIPLFLLPILLSISSWENLWSGRKQTGRVAHSELFQEFLHWPGKSGHCLWTHEGHAENIRARNECEYYQLCLSCIYISCPSSSELKVKDRVSVPPPFTTMWSWSDKEKVTGSLNEFHNSVATWTHMEHTTGFPHWQVSPSGILQWPSTSSMADRLEKVV